MSNTNTNKANGDTSGHYDSATIANARKYYTLLDDNGRDKAKLIVDELIRKGQLKDSAFYVNGYKGEIQRRENIKKREDARKAAEEKAKEDFMRAKAENEAKDSGDYTINPEIDAIIKSMIDKGATKATIAGALKVLTKFNKTQIARYMADNMPERAKASKKGNDDLFNEYCVQERRSDDDMIAFINASGSNNFIKFTPHLLKRGAFFRAIHDKYSN